MKTSMGRAAIFLIPAGKMKMACGQITISEAVREFLTNTFGAFQESTEHISGYWRGCFDGTFVQFKVAFLGKKRIVLLDDFLEGLAHTMGELSIYEETGEDAWEISPDPDKKYQL